MLKFYRAAGRGDEVFNLQQSHDDSGDSLTIGDERHRENESVVQIVRSFDPSVNSNLWQYNLILVRKVVANFNNEKSFIRFVRLDFSYAEVMIVIEPGARNVSLSVVNGGYFTPLISRYPIDGLLRSEHLPWT